jgi:hypothetical protein
MNSRPAPADLEIDSPIPPSPFADISIVLQMAAPLGRDYVLKTIAKDPRFPRPVIGGSGPGSRRIWARRKVGEYFEELAENGEYAATPAT